MILISSKLSWKALWCVKSALLFLLISCAGTAEFYEEIDREVSSGNYHNALNEIRESRQLYGENSSVLFDLDMGLLFHYAGLYDSSTNHFFNAERQIEDLYTKSISREALSLILNDNILPYEGEDFEKVLVNVFLALNYARQGMTDDALVEARKVDLKFREYSRKYEDKNRYKDDAFIRYLAGVLYESGGEINDAFISYQKAYDAYQFYSSEYGTKAPSFLLDDLVRTATMLDFSEEAEQYRSLGGKPFIRGAKHDGSVIFIIYSGKGPIKEEVRPTVRIPDSSGTIHTFQIALPKFVPRNRENHNYIINLVSGNDTLSSHTELAEDITAIAEKTLDDRLTLIYLKSGGRALIKFLAAEKMKKEMKKGSDNILTNILGSLAVDAAIGATEQADLRTWRTLPAEIQLARFNVQPGRYQIHVLDGSEAHTLKVDTVHVKAGRSSIAVAHDIR